MLLSHLLFALLPLAVVASPATTKASSTTTTTTKSTTTTSKSTTTTSKASSTTTSSATTTTSKATTTTSKATTSSTTTPNAYSNFCSAENTIITSLKATATATSFCSSYLSIPTLTFSSTATITPLPNTVTTTATATTSYVTVTVSSVTTTIITNTATVTSATGITTTTTTTATCFSSAYSALQKRDFGKRGGTSSIATPSCIPSTWAASLVSSACSCLNIPTPSTTLSFKTTLVPLTVTNTATVTPTGTITTTTTSIVTSITTTTTTVTTTSTTVVTATSAVANGVTYRQYTDTDDANNIEPNFPVAEIQAQTPVHSGTTNDVNFSDNGGGYIYLGDGYGFQSAQAAVVMQGYFVAPETGNYIFYSLGNVIDNWNILWTGDAAYTWQDGTYAYEASRTGPTAATYQGGQTTLSMNAGDAVPMTFLYANGGAAATSYYYFTTNDGNFAGDPINYLTQPCPGSPFT